MTDTATVTATMSRYVHAITRMLVNKHVLKPGLAITAGQILNPAGVGPDRHTRAPERDGHHPSRF